jgi:hypothetical protein
MVHNSAAIEEIDSGRWHFAPPEESRALLCDGEAGWLWPLSVLRSESTLLVSCARLVRDNDNLFGARRVGTCLAIAPIGPGPADTWPFRYHPLPGFRGDAEGDRYLGAAIVAVGADLCVLGADEQFRDGAGQPYPEGRSVTLAKLPGATFPQSAPPLYWSGDGWDPEEDRAVRLFSGAPPLLGLERTPTGWLTAYVRNGAGREIVWRHAPDLHGPWSPARLLFRCWRPWFRGHHYCYAAQIVGRSAGRLQISYSVNSFRGIGQHLRQARLYWPHFVTVPEPQV